MSPFFNAQSGELSEEAGDADVPDSGVSSPDAPSPDAPGPAAPTLTDPGPTITRERTVHETVSIATMTPEDALAAYDRMHAAWGKDPQLGDDRTPEGQAFHARLEALIMRGKGLAPEENRVLGTVHEGGRLRPVETEPAGAYEEAPEAGVIANRPAQDAAMSLARNLGGASVEVFQEFLYEASRLYASGEPPNEIALHQQLTAEWPTLAARQAIDERLTDLYAALDRMGAEQGVTPAEREVWLAELTRIESYGVKGIKYLLGPFTQSLWDRGPAAFADAYAMVQGEEYEAQQLRIAKAQREDETPEDHVVMRGGRP